MKEASYHRTRLAAISRRLGSNRVFGAGYKGHHFELTLHSPDEITVFEEQLGVRLPEEYVRLLTETGSGAGPYYGLLAPRKILGRNREIEPGTQPQGPQFGNPERSISLSAI
jgi:hypothetical protein